MMVQWQQDGVARGGLPKDKVNGKFILPPWVKKQ